MDQYTVYIHQTGQLDHETRPHHHQERLGLRNATSSLLRKREKHPDQAISVAEKHVKLIFFYQRKIDPGLEQHGNISSNKTTRPPRCGSILYSKSIENDRFDQKKMIALFSRLDVTKVVQTLLVCQRQCLFFFNSNINFIFTKKGLQDFTPHKSFNLTYKQRDLVTSKFTAWTIHYPIHVFVVISSQ